MQLASHIHVLETGSVAVHGATEELKSDPELAKAYFGH